MSTMHQQVLFDIRAELRKRGHAADLVVTGRDVLRRSARQRARDAKRNAVRKARAGYAALLDEGKRPNGGDARGPGPFSASCPEAENVAVSVDSWLERGK